MVVIGTEVAHSECAKQPVNTITLGQRYKSDNDRLRAELERERRAFGEANHRLALEVETRRKVERERDGYKLQIDSVEANLSSILDEVKRLKADRDEYRIARDRAVAERDAARREAALYQQLSGASGSGDGPSADKGQSEEKDGTVVRFSLLELD